MCVSSNNITDVLWREGETNWTNIAVGASFSDVVLEDYFASADDRYQIGARWCGGQSDHDIRQYFNAKKTSDKKCSSISHKQYCFVHINDILFLEHTCD